MKAATLFVECPIKVKISGNLQVKKKKKKDLMDIQVVRILEDDSKTKF